MIERKHFKICIVQVFLSIIGYNVFAQKITLFEDDSLSDKYVDINIDTPEWKINKNYRVVVPIDFNEKLPDGEYIYKGMYKRDTSKTYILMTGKFVDSLREGPFKYYTADDSGNSYLILTYNYKKGQLDGSYFEYGLRGIRDQGFYEKGMRNGFFISYDDSSNIKSIEVYSMDTLSYWIIYKYEHNHQIFSSGCGEGDLMSGEYKRYYNSGSIYISAYLVRGMVTKYTEYFPSGKIKKEGIGLFEKTKSELFHTIDPFILIRGTLKEYNENGILIKAENK
jgi:antitoxin component YwqK of YwqJK toxin-antitoxin module